MAKVTYMVVKRDGGWGYEFDGSFSETFATHDDARAAARRAAMEQRIPGNDATISWEDEGGHWHEESVHGDDRPSTDVEG